MIKGALFEYTGVVKVARRTEGIEKRKKKVDCVGGPRFHFVPPLPFFSLSAQIIVEKRAEHLLALPQFNLSRARHAGHVQ